jgi:uncharacterized metal-binding protein
MSVTSVLILVGTILLVLCLSFWFALAAIIFIGAATYADAHDEDFEDHRSNK